ncbi:zinc finger protein 211-like [Myotis yumanensis]|uniref:zinc finger protein 211-like n=1 Tax=Myotis yumanensis TaxID=159337 RepID=UPI0038D449C9
MLGSHLLSLSSHAAPQCEPDSGGPRPAECCQIEEPAGPEDGMVPSLQGPPVPWAVDSLTSVLVMAEGCALPSVNTVLEPKPEPEPRSVPPVSLVPEARLGSGEGAHSPISLEPSTLLDDAPTGAVTIQQEFFCYWHEKDYYEACSNQSVSVEGESQVRASETAPATQKNHPCKQCFSVLKENLHLSELQAAHLEHKGFFSEACVRDFCSSANPHQQQRNARGKTPWKEATDRASFVTRCSFYLSEVSSNSRVVGEDSQTPSELLQYQATHNTEEPQCDSEISKEFLSGQCHLQWGECENAASHNLNVVGCLGVCSGECGTDNNLLLIYKGVHTGEKAYACVECGKSFRDNFSSLATREFTLEKSSLSVQVVESPSVIVPTSFDIREFTLVKSLMSVVLLLIHKSFHTGEKPYVCSEYGKSFTRNNSLLIHKRVHTGEKPYECGEYGNCFRDNIQLFIHNRVHTGEKPYVCSECGKCFRKNRQLLIHKVRRCLTGVYTAAWGVDTSGIVKSRLHCQEQCSFYLSSVPSTSRKVGEDFKYNSEFPQHQPTSNAEELHCGSGISQEFLDGKSLHQGGEYENAGSNDLKFGKIQGVCYGELTYECNKCKKVFRQIFNLIQHKRVHTGEKLYECRECGMSFSQRSHLTGQLRVHTGEQPYECTECGNSFSQTSNLIKHLKVHSCDKPYECYDCGKFFSDKSYLEKHHRVHSGEKSYECRKCGMSFQQRAQLTVHLRVRTVENP